VLIVFGLYLIVLKILFEKGFEKNKTKQKRKKKREKKTPAEPPSHPSGQPLSGLLTPPPWPVNGGPVGQLTRALSPFLAG